MILDAKLLLATIFTAVTVANAALAQSRIPLVVTLNLGSESANRSRIDALREGMRELGYIEGKNYRMEARWGNNDLERLPALAGELLQMRPDVAVGAPVIGAQAFYNQSKSVPIVMATGAGALGSGIIASMARPGGNVTGVTNQGDELTQKLFEFLKDIAPRAKRVAALSSGRSLVESEVWAAAHAAARTYGMTLIELHVTSAAQSQQLAHLCSRQRCEALVVLLDPYLYEWRSAITGAAASLRIPAVYSVTEYAESGGLLTYSAEPREQFRRAAYYVDKILKGVKPADLPVEQPTKFELVINMKTAKALGVTIPQSILVQANRIIN